MPTANCNCSCFVIVALAAFAVASLLDQRSARARLIKERLATVQKAPEREPDAELALLRDEQLSKIPALDTLLRRSERVSAIQESLAQAGMKFRAGNFLDAVPALRRGRRLRRHWSGAGILRIGWAALVIGLSFPTRSSLIAARSASKNSKSFFPKPLIRWPAPSAPATLLPLPWK